MGFGGWSLGVHHVYDPSGRVLYMGDGKRRSADRMPSIIETAVGNGEEWVPSLDDGNTEATDAAIAGGIVVTTNSEGSLFFTTHGRVYSVFPWGGTVRLFAGGGVADPVDGGNAFDASFASNIEGIAIDPDDNVYITESTNHRVWKIHRGQDLFGFRALELYAGNGYSPPEDCTPGGSCPGDGGPAKEAELYNPWGLAFSPDGDLYIADSNHNVVRRVDPAGIISTFAGGGQDQSPNFGNGGPANDAWTGNVKYIALGPDGSLYMTEWGWGQVRRVSPDGIITRFAGGGDIEDNIDKEGILATDVKINQLQGLTVSKDGILYTSSEHGYIWSVDQNGILASVAGEGELRFVFEEDGGDDGPAILATIQNVADLSVGPDGILYVAELSSDRIRKISPPISGYNLNDIIIPAEDGSEYYVFEPNGQHRETVDRLTGSAVYRFWYDNGLLMNIEDVDGDIYLIGRDNDGNMESIRPPGCIVDLDCPITTFEYFNNGYLKAVKDPTNRSHYFSYQNGGLLRELRDPRNKLYTFAYNEDGKLEYESNPAGGYKELVRTNTYEPEQPAVPEQAPDEPGQPARPGKRGYYVEVTTAENNTATYSFYRNAYGGIEYNTNFHFNGNTSSTLDRDGAITIIYPDTTEIEIDYSPDPLFGVVAKSIGEYVVSIPGTSYGYTLYHESDPDENDPLLYDTLDETYTYEYMLDGVYVERIKTEHYDKTHREYTIMAPSCNDSDGDTTCRSHLIQLDDNGRIIRKEIVDTRPTTRLYPLHYCYRENGMMDKICNGVCEDGQGNRCIDVSGEDRIFTFSYKENTEFVDGVEDPMGRAVNLGRDDSGRVTYKDTTDDKRVELNYDNNGNLWTIKPPLGDEYIHEMTYNGVNDLEYYIPPYVEDIDNLATYYKYNKERKPVGVYFPDGEITTHDYSRSQLAGVRHPYGYTEIKYKNNTVQIEEINTSIGINIRYTYDGFLLKGEETRDENPFDPPMFSVRGVYYNYYNDFTLHTIDCYLCSQIVHEYEVDGLMKNVGSLTIQRDDYNGLVSGSTLVNINTETLYNRFGEIEDFYARNVDDLIYYENYERDKLGRITGKTETIREQNLDNSTTYYEYIYTYSIYDDNNIEIEVDGGRLERVYKTIDQERQLVAKYVYDDNGNRMKKCFDEDCSTEYINAVYDNQDRLRIYGNTEYHYNDDGGLKYKKVIDGNESTKSYYEYDKLGNLRKTFVIGGNNIEYIIDGRNRRIGKKINGILVQQLLYKDQLNPIAEYDGDGNLKTQFVYGTKMNVPEYMIRYGVIYRIISDQLGSPRLVVNVDTGDIVQRIDYDEFGIVIDCRDENGNQCGENWFQPFGFAGGLYEPTTKLVRFGERDYDPETGRWTQKDAIIDVLGQSVMGLYQYVGSDPINRIDPSGKQSGGESGSGVSFDWPTLTLKLPFLDIRFKPMSSMGGPPLDPSGYSGWLFSEEMKFGSNIMKKCLPETTLDFKPPSFKDFYNNLFMPPPLLSELNLDLGKLGISTGSSIVTW